ncbi:ketopantoate reductase family protein [Pseudidiomarina sp. E22-M8]|uniref:ketopantoate reductase family protein n=1 Tax=Pseudidiomarina sp. E22-M8 TaxID=3424768 RepID=UPI00403CD9EE
MTDKRPWLVIGQGAIGSLMAVKLAAIDVPVQLKLRSENDVIDDEQLIRLGSQSLRLATVDKLTTPSWIFAAVKAYQVAPLIRELRTSKAYEASTLIVSYNGMLRDETTLMRGSDLHWVTTHGAYRDADKIVHAGHGQSWLGPQQSGQNAPHEVMEQLARALPPLTWEDDIARRRWQKLAVNCLINPFTVLHKCRNGEILQHVTPELWRQVAYEIQVLAQYHGIELAVATLLQQAEHVVQATANNRSSMLQDYSQRRPTEIDYLNGFIASASAEAGLSAPANQQLWQQVAALTGDLGPR